MGKIYEVLEMQCRPSPLIDGDRFIVFTGAKPGASVLALDKKTGNEIWKALDDHVSNSSPLIIEAGGQRQLIVWSNDSVTSLNPATGATWWRERLVTAFSVVEYISHRFGKGGKGTTMDSKPDFDPVAAAAADGGHH